MHFIHGLAVAFAALLTATPSMSAIIAENQVGTQAADNGLYYLGQSFKAEGTGSYNNASISFYTGRGAAIPYADETLYLYSQAYTGLVSALGSGPGFVASTVGARGSYDFGASVFVNAGHTYYAYMNTRSPVAIFAGGNPYAGGELFQADESTGLRFVGGYNSDLRFGASGTPSSVTAAVPEPATWIAMILGFAGIGAAMRRRRSTSVGSLTATARPLQIR